MRTATCQLVSLSAYSQSKAFEVDRLEGETLDMKETRTWREKCHSLPDGRLFIPPMAFTLGLQYAAKRMGRKVPGAGNKTYTKSFENGILCLEPVVLAVTKATVACERVHVNADGVRGSGKRVFKNFPIVPEWKGTLVAQVLMEDIPNALFEETLQFAGAFAGVGRFRPEKGGYLGRYEAKSVKWS